MDERIESQVRQDFDDFQRQYLMRQAERQRELEAEKRQMAEDLKRTMEWNEKSGSLAALRRSSRCVNPHSSEPSRPATWGAALGGSHDEVPGFPALRPEDRPSYSYPDLPDEDVAPDPDIGPEEMGKPQIKKCG